MKTSTVKEQPVITLKYSDWENSWERPVYSKELRELKVGDLLKTEPEKTSSRSVEDESYEVVYKTDNGIAMLHRTFGVGSYPDFREWDDVELVWIELH